MMTQSNAPAPPQSVDPFSQTLQAAEPSSVRDGTAQTSNPPAACTPITHAIETAREQRAGDFAYQSIQQHFQSVVERRSAVLADRDPEDLHQMRVGLRRLRTAIALFDPVVELPELVCDRSLASVAKTLGKLRDRDVLQAWFEQYQRQQKPPKAEAKILAKLHERLHEQRKSAMAAVKVLLQGPDYGAIVRALQHWLQQPCYRTSSQWPVRALLPDLLLPLLSQLLLHPGWWTAVTLEGDRGLPQSHLNAKASAAELLKSRAALHELRKQAKRLRDPAELLRDCFGQTYGDRLGDFKAIQTVLGQFQDEVVLSRFLKKSLGKSWAKQLPSLEKFFHQQHQGHWQQWQALQAQYLDLEFRQALRQLILA